MGGISVVAPSAFMFSHAECDPKSHNNNKRVKFSSKLHKGAYPGMAPGTSGCPFDWIEHELCSAVLRY